MNTGSSCSILSPDQRRLHAYEKRVFAIDCGFLLDICVKRKSADQSVELSAKFDRARFDKGLFDTFSIRHLAPVQRANGIRQAEYLAGRVLARLASLHLAGTEAEILCGAAGEPIWPDGLTGSISHSNDLVMCVASADLVKCVGVDVQHRLSKAERVAVCDTALTRRDISTLDAMHRLSDLDLALVFSAKETVFKALFPSTRVYIDFEDFAVSGITTDGHILMHANSAKGEEVWGKDTCLVQYELHDDYVVTRLICNRRG